MAEGVVEKQITSDTAAGRSVPKPSALTREGLTRAGLRARYRAGLDPA